MGRRRNSGSGRRPEPPRPDASRVPPRHPEVQRVGSRTARSRLLRTAPHEADHWSCDSWESESFTTFHAGNRAVDPNLVSAPDDHVPLSGHPWQQHRRYCEAAAMRVGGPTPRPMSVVALASCAMNCSNSERASSTIRSRCCSKQTAVMSGIAAAPFGNIPTTRERWLISALAHSGGCSATWDRPFAHPAGSTWSELENCVSGVTGREDPRPPAVPPPPRRGRTLQQPRSTAVRWPSTSTWQRGKSREMSSCDMSTQRAVKLIVMASL